MHFSVLVLLAVAVEAKHGVHDALHNIHRRHRQERENSTIERRSVSCAFPTDAGLVAVTPGSGNGGWAFAPDQSCTAGRFCPYACPPGQVSMQWDPLATSYSYPMSRNGGLLCGLDGKLSKPFPDKPYCQATSKNIGVLNSAGSVVTFCQTVLPGDEDMLIPTIVSDWSSIAVPDPNYWASTAAHYYINPPGTGSEGCVWGTNSKPVGNWAPYVAGANADHSGQTFIKVGWNPVYLEAASSFHGDMPNWGVRIECPNGGCNGLPCGVDPTQNKVNEMMGGVSSGAGGGTFCVVTVQKGSSANFVVFGTDSKAGQFYQSSAVAAAAATTTAAALSAATSSTSIAAPSTTISSTASILKPSSTSVTVSTAVHTSSSPAYQATSSSYPSTVNGGNSTNNSPKASSGQPYYSLFNTTAPSASDQSGSDATTAIVGPVNTRIAAHTSSSSTITVSAGMIMLVVAGMILY